MTTPTSAATTTETSTVPAGTVSAVSAGGHRSAGHEHVWGAGPELGLHVVATGRKPPTYRLASEKEVAVDQMRELREKGQLSAATRAPIAARLHVTDRSLRNWLREADDRDEAAAGTRAGEVGRPRFTLSTDDVDARARFASDSEWSLWLLAKAMATNEAATREAGEPVVLIPEVHRTTAIRALYRQESAAIVAGLRGGEADVPGASARFDVDHQLGDKWHGDLTYLPVAVRLRANSIPIQPVWVAFREPVSGRIMAEALLPERPTAAVIAAIIGQGLTQTQLPDGTPLLAPRQVRLDNAGEHVADELTTRLAGVGISVSLNTDSHASWQNGSIEKFWDIAKSDVLMRVPGARNLGRRRDGSVYNDLPDGDTVAFDDLAVALTSYVASFNAEQHSDAHEGRVPDQVWAEEVAAVSARGSRRPKAELVATLALVPSDPRRKYQTISQRGIQVGPRFLTGVSITDHVGRKVVVRRWPNPALGLAEVFAQNGRDYLGRVALHHQLTEDDRNYVRCTERSNRNRVNSAKHQARHKYAGEFTILSGPAPAAGDAVRPHAAGQTPGWHPGETVADGDAFDRSSTSAPADDRAATATATATAPATAPAPAPAPDDAHPTKAAEPRGPETTAGTSPRSRSRVARKNAEGSRREEAAGATSGAASGVASLNPFARNEPDWLFDDDADGSHDDADGSHDEGPVTA